MTSLTLAAVVTALSGVPRPSQIRHPMGLSGQAEAARMGLGRVGKAMISS